MIIHEYIPLEPEIFDIVIIDEASQVSIAQAFPALLRAKRVIIFGDKKQFSNVKTALARSDINNEYLNNLEDCFKKSVSNDRQKLTRLKKFNIKTSILEFFEFISNFDIQLLKHFRCYKEMISYSNENFYLNNLQVMKIRGKNIDDVIKFSFIENDNKEELIPNTNITEIEYIMSELQKLKDSDYSGTVGIITPHTNQQKSLMEGINKLPESNFYFENFKLKIMTFDTCQGEERDTIFYSMVANKVSDRLWGVFIKNLRDIDLEGDGKIKAQRLNVGFSRAKESMHFILSKPLEEFSGSIGEALRHYDKVLKESRKEKNVSDVDKKSQMEPEVMNWFYQTIFYKNNKDKIEFCPQFKLGKYLKQLSSTYNYPEYIVDFLLFFNDKQHESKIIIEYDGFKEHFNDEIGINKFNYRNYYNEETVYRQKVLESYGYNFISINKFNIGKNPVETLNNRIQLSISGKNENSVIREKISDNYEELKNGDMKECPKCKKIKPIEEFYDSSLINNYGRFCNDCKSSARKKYQYWQKNNRRKANRRYKY